MSDYPPPENGTAAGTAGTTDHDPARKWKTWHLATAAIVALLLGIGMGGAGSETVDTDAASDPAPGETVTVTETVQAQEGEPVPAETVTVTAQPEEQAAEAPAESNKTGDYQAGSYTFSDVQVSEDFAGDFEVRARGTNTGSEKQGVCISVSIFSGGSVVGSADACISDWAADETRTVEFVSTDDYQDWDELEFQVNSEF